MSREIKRAGNYQRFETTQRYHMISLDEEDFYVWRGPDRLELSDFGHEASEILHEGDYFLFIPRNEPGLKAGIPHLACQEGEQYRVYLLPQGLPSRANQLVDILEAPELLPRESIFV